MIFSKFYILKEHVLYTDGFVMLYIEYIYAVSFQFFDYNEMESTTICLLLNFDITFILFLLVYGKWRDILIDITHDIGLILGSTFQCLPWGFGFDLW